MSDELIRSLTVFFLSFGKILRDNISTHTRTGSVGSNEDAGRSSRLSLEGVRRLPDADSRDAVDEWGRRNAGGRGSDSGRRSLESPARRLELGMESYPRSSTSMSRTRAGSPVQRPGTASPDPSHSRKSGVFSAFSSTSRRFFTSRKGIQSPSIGNPTLSMESSTYESPTPARHVDPERMPGRSSLDYERSTLPSESSQNRSPERNRLRKNKTSTTSNATVRGSSILPSVSTALPAQVTITPAINSPEEFDLRSGSLSKAPATSSDDDYNTHPHYVHQERAQRKRTISITSDMDEDPSSTPINTTTTRVDMRGLRPRQSPNTPVTTGRDRERRRTLTGLFS
ncbi:uncharacterized protein EI90DRAFT_2279951 [Cantharellus anzutake]|uniref:uncharacterized protein n=1 Tax=Cantharellus anzutake TaxID=1750568 RepID=UPI00190764DA|nr:uncharacterized protein EI90DRAFT_2279951 [Cantharellus anzutake]KAF8339750.1 hypothetical protein EI90DRAFT_2279951 [Cantharellus anzutake]